MKYAPANDEGLKPYVVTLRTWNRERTKVVYCERPQDARYEAGWGRLGAGEYVTNVRRARPIDVELLA